MNDPDAIWKPGYDGPPPIVPAPFGGPAPDADLERHRDHPRARQELPHGDRPQRHRVRLALGIGTPVVLALAAALVVIDRRGTGDDPTPDAGQSTTADGATDTAGVVTEPSATVVAHPNRSVFGGPDARRLPARATLLWTVDVPSDHEHWIEVVGREIVVAAVAGPPGASLPAGLPGSPGGSATSIVALEASDGAPRWTLTVAADVGDVSVVGSVDDVLVLEHPAAGGRTVTGVDIGTGEQLWTVAAAPNDGHVGLIGTRFVARLPSSPARLVLLVDATSGSVVGSIASDPDATGRPGGWSTDGKGAWYVAAEGQLLRYELSTGVGPSRVEGKVNDPSWPRMVVGDRIGGAGAGDLVGEDGGSGESTADDRRSAVQFLMRQSGQNLVVTAPRTVPGTALPPDALTVRWLHAKGLVVGVHPVHDGALLEVAPQSGGRRTLVDDGTGDTVIRLATTTEVLRSLVVTGNGIAMPRTTEDRTEIAGLDLDGRERWTIEGPAPVVVGDGVVVRATPTPSHLRLTAFGDVD